MAIAELARPETKSLNDRDLAHRLQAMRATDNSTNLYYLARTWIFLVVVIGSAIAFPHLARSLGWSWWWNVPVAVVAITLIGAGQHQLTGLAHEASHHILFRHRLWNDLASDWFCMFPLFSSTHHYRLQHMAHHQFVNDPDRDPDVSQLRTSGHWLDFPITRKEFWRTVLRQAWLPNLIRYIRVRAMYNSMGTTKNPYLRKNWKPSKIPFRVGLVYMLGLVAGLTWLVQIGNPVLLAVVPACAWLGMIAFYTAIPARWYHQSRVKPVIPSRWMTLMRITFITALFSSLAWITHLTGEWAAIDFLLYWILPMVTSFSFFMILRQLVQHGNGDRGWLTNTRVFHVPRFLNFCVFPMGQEYHLPHHMYASIPHYRLAELHKLLLQYPEYREQALVVEGYFASPGGSDLAPCVLDVLGADHVPHSNDVYIDDSVLDHVLVEGREEIVGKSASASD